VRLFGDERIIAYGFHRFTWISFVEFFIVGFDYGMEPVRFQLYFLVLYMFVLILIALLF